MIRNSPSATTRSASAFRSRQELSDSSRRRSPLQVAADLLEAESQPSRWRLEARDKQLPPPGAWNIWLISAGRGWGKTRVGAETFAEWLLGAEKGTEWAIIAPKFADARSVCMEGPSGLLKALPESWAAGWNRSNFELSTPRGAKVFLYGAEDPRVGVRGRNLSGCWADELAAWRYREVWDEGLMPALRIGERPRVIATTTPRNVPLIRDLLNRDDGSVAVTRGHTWENEANLSPAALAELKARYEGTRLGRQELYGELLEDVDGALWSWALIDGARVSEAPAMARVVVAIDPAVTSGADADETGIVVVGKGVDGHAYVLSDRTCRMSPDGWGRRAVGAYHEFAADRLVAEVNNGGEMVELTVRTIDRNVAFKAVHATRGKRVRAEPVSALYEQGRVHHVAGADLAKLEDQMVTFLPEGSQGSPDRVDALVWALTELMLEGSAENALAFMRERAAEFRAGVGVA